MREIMTPRESSFLGYLKGFKGTGKGIYYAKFKKVYQGFYENTYYTKPPKTPALFKNFDPNDDSVIEDNSANENRKEDAQQQAFAFVKGMRTLNFDKYNSQSAQVKQTHDVRAYWEEKEIGGGTLMYPNIMENEKRIPHPMLQYWLNEKRILEERFYEGTNLNGKGFFTLNNIKFKTDKYSEEYIDAILFASDQEKGLEN